MWLVSWYIFKCQTTGLCLQSPLQDLLHILRQSSQLSLGISLTGVLLWAKYGERPVEDCPCQLDRSPTWLFWEWLYPVLLVISCTVETGWTWPQVSARSPLSHLCGCTGWVLRSAWFHLGTRCGLLLTFWVCKMMPFKRDRDKITLGLYLVWFVCKV